MNLNLYTTISIEVLNWHSLLPVTTTIRIVSVGIWLSWLSGNYSVFVLKNSVYVDTVTTARESSGTAWTQRLSIFSNGLNSACWMISTAAVVIPGIFWEKCVAVLENFYGCCIIFCRKTTTQRSRKNSPAGCFFSCLRPEIYPRRSPPGLLILMAVCSFFW